jgi:hypothetical protein
VGGAKDADSMVDFRDRGAGTEIAAAKLLLLRSSKSSKFGATAPVRECSILAAGGSRVKARPARGESGENDGNEVRDLSEAAIDDAELDCCEIFLGLEERTVDRWLRVETALCWETERSSGEAWSGANSKSMSKPRHLVANDHGFRSRGRWGGGSQGGWVK